MTKNACFFDEKKSWSLTKDDLLRCYLKPYFSKISKRGKPIVYFDGFAGPGAFGDGSQGSPLIALGVFDGCGINIPATFVFSESGQSYWENLEKACEPLREGRDISVLENFEDGCEAVLASRSDSSVFAYVDPYGFKHLDFDCYRRLGERFGSVEILLNFCSVGVLREMYCVFEKEELIPSDVDFGREQGAASGEGMEIRRQRLDRVLGGGWWRDLMAQRLGFWELERRISDGLCVQMRECFKYVLNMPITDSARNDKLKYRMIHMTQHPDGCILMNDNMAERKIGAQVQQTLLPMDIEGCILDSVRESEIGSCVRVVVDEIPFGAKVPLKEVYASIMNRIGVVYKHTEIGRKLIGPLEDEGILARTPDSRRGWSNAGGVFFRKAKRRPGA